MDPACLDLLSSGVVLLDGRGVARHVNTAAEELLGRSRRQLLGEPAIERFEGDESWKANFSQAIRGELGIVHQEVVVAGGASGPTKLGLTIVPLHAQPRSEEHTSELQSLMRISYAVFCLLINISY